MCLFSSYYFLHNGLVCSSFTFLRSFNMHHPTLRSVRFLVKADQAQANQMLEKREKINVKTEISRPQRDATIAFVVVVVTATTPFSCRLGRLTFIFADLGVSVRKRKVERRKSNRIEFGFFTFCTATPLLYHLLLKSSTHHIRLPLVFGYYARQATHRDGL
ncbi:hypothetical protein EDC96DRAFT_507699 [Choanephora cucurbitarum]|nr:hypothetical protein EDC96DRAFT_507699 [Choanephora cucurbitarum]